MQVAMVGNAKKRRKSPKPGKRQDYVVVSNRSYGSALKGTRIYFEGRKPSMLKDDGTIALGKHLLEALRAKYSRFRWTITQSIDSITTEYNIVRVRTSLALLKRMHAEQWARSRDIKTDIVRRFLSIAFPIEFTDVPTTTYVPGTLARILDAKIVSRLSSQDKEAIDAFLPEYVAGESLGTVQKLKASAQIQTLNALASDFEREIKRAHPESWWQSYIKANILLMQQGYIKALDKLNVAIGETKFPDFCLVTHDNYLDILEIKKPDTPLLKLDSGRGNYYWDTEMSKATSQTENYIEQVMSKASEVRSYLLDREGINIKAVRPRGIILAGSTQAFGGQKERDDFRLLSQGSKNITVVTYDELLTRLNNYIGVLKSFSGPRGTRTPDAQEQG